MRGNGKWHRHRLHSRGFPISAYKLGDFLVVDVDFPRALSAR